MKNKYNININNITEVKVSPDEKKKILKNSAETVFSNKIVNETLKELSKK